ncbi:hypothetical protein ACVBEH_18585 [Roseateles sp. GG27B]
MLAVCLLLPAFAASAHKSSDAYLQLSRSEAGLTLRWDIALRDLDAALLLDRNDDRNITWGEVKAKLPEIEQLARQGLELNGGQCRCNCKATVPALVDGAIRLHWWRLPARVSGIAGPSRKFAYAMSFADIDPTHRGRCVWTRQGGGSYRSTDAGSKRCCCQRCGLP